MDEVLDIIIAVDLSFNLVWNLYTSGVLYSFTFLTSTHIKGFNIICYTLVVACLRTKEGTVKKKGKPV